MAVGVVKLTKKGRRSFAVAIISLLLVETFLGLWITSWSIYVCTGDRSILSTEKSEVNFVFTVTGMYGTHVLFHNLTGIKICQKCYSQAYKFVVRVIFCRILTVSYCRKSTKNLLFVWTLAGCNTILNMLILIVLALRISKHLTRSIRHSLEKGMTNYLKDPFWKYTIDNLQVTLECCGVEDYDDWYDFPWIDEYRINTNSNVVKELQSSKDSLPVTPWSCCRMDYPLQCFHDPLQQRESGYLWKEQPRVVLESVHDKGCLDLIKLPVDTALWGYIVLTILIFLIQVTTISLIRILYTSCRNAILLNNIDGMAPGWIFGRGDCGWSYGPGLYEFLENTQQASNVSESSTSSQKSSKKRSLTKSTKSEDEPVCSCEEDALMLM